MPRTAQYDREAALDKAVTLFWARGYHNTSMKLIEQTLDMRPGSLYAAFGNKEALFAEALEVYAARMAEQLMQLDREQGSPLEALKYFLRELVSGCARSTPAPSRACMIVKTLLETGDEERALRLRAEQLLAAMEEAIADMLERARAQGELRAEVDCKRLARLLQVQIMGLRTFAERDIEPTSLEQLLDDVFALIDAYKNQ